MGRKNNGKDSNTFSKFNIQALSQAVQRLLNSCNELHHHKQVLHSSTVGLKCSGLTWRGVTERNSLPDLDQNGVQLSDFCASHSLSITNTIQEHKRVHMCTCHQDPIARRSAINFDARYCRRPKDSLSAFCRCYPVNTKSIEFLQNFLNLKNILKFKNFQGLFLKNLPHLFKMSSPLLCMS